VSIFARVIPGNAGILANSAPLYQHEIPAFAGMT